MRSSDERLNVELRGLLAPEFEKLRVTSCPLSNLPDRRSGRRGEV